MNEAELTQAVSTRISHDLIGNIGAVSNAVELLEEGDMDFLPDIKSILKISSEVLSSRLNFFRMAFGLDNSNLEDMSVVCQTTENYLKTIGNRNFPIALDFHLSSSGMGRMAMLSIMSIADCLIKGGRIEVGDDNGRLLVMTDTPSLSVEKLNWLQAIAGGQIPENKAFYAPMLYLQHLVEQHHHQIRVLTQKGLALLIE